MSNAKEIQQAFLQKVKSALPSNLSLVDELADLLDTSNDSAYRRLRGETLLSIDEIARICTHFKVSLDTSVHPESETVTFEYKRLKRDKNDFVIWINTLLDNVKRVASVPEGSILYAADDVPVWHHFANDEFLCFKLFYWLKSILNEPDFKDKKFDTELIDPELIRLSKELLNQYNNTISTEIWTEDTLNSTLKQVEYFWESGFFKDKATALRMCDYIQEEVDLIYRKAEQNSKLIAKGESGKENFTLYRSDVMVGNNSIIVKLGENKIAFVSNNTFNFMSTTNPGFVEENEYWIRNLIRKSVQISGISEKQRNQFFSVLNNKIDDLRKRIS